jgi:hypothetical protein
MNEVAVAGSTASANEERSVSDVLSQVVKIQELMSKVMHKDEHYGIIPGTGKKPSLLKAGAEKLCFVFRLAPEFEVAIDNLANGHREYRVTCRLRNMSTGNLVGEGVGSCSTMESKYRYRNASDYEITDQAIPKDAKERKAEYRKQGFGMKQVDGSWVWVRYKSEGKVENPDIADTYNTVLKMAKKRAHVDATITATAASDIFTQDVEDLPGMVEESVETEAKPVDEHEAHFDEYRERMKVAMESGFFTEAEQKAYGKQIADKGGMKKIPAKDYLEIVKSAEAEQEAREALS